MRRAIAYAVGFCALASFAQSGDDLPKPPKGWKEHTPQDKAFTVWIPENPKRQLERERVSTIRGLRIKMTILHIEMQDGLIYHVEKLSLPGALIKINRKELQTSLKDMLLTEFRGKLGEETDAKLGAISGKEYLVETGKGLARARVFVTGSRVVIIHAEGTKEQVQDKGTLVFLDSCKLGSGTAVASGGDPGKGDRTKIQGGAFDPEFKDEASEGGLLVGLEIGLGKFISSDVVKAVRPIYRVDNKESLGMQYGTNTSRVVKIVAKPGYAVGAITTKAGLLVDGMSITYMKIEQGRLDTKDSYESDWVGGKGGGAPVRLAGNGTPIVGIIGKANKMDMTGLGLVLRP